MNTLFLWLAAIIYVEAVTELLHRGSIFEKQREFLHRFSSFTSQLIECGYCLSVWVAATIAWTMPIPISDYKVVNTAVAILVLHRLSNIVHEGIMRWFSRIPYTFMLYHSHKIEEDTNGQAN